MEKEEKEKKKEEVEGVFTICAVAVNSTANSLSLIKRKAVHWAFRTSYSAICLAPFPVIS